MVMKVEETRPENGGARGRKERTEQRERARAASAPHICQRLQRSCRVEAGDLPKTKLGRHDSSKTR